MLHNHEGVLKDPDSIDDIDRSIALGNSKLYDVNASHLIDVER